MRDGLHTEHGDEERGGIDPALAERITRYLDGTADDADVEALEAALSTDAEARRYFRIACAIGSGLSTDKAQRALEPAPEPLAVIKPAAQAHRPALYAAAAVLVIAGVAAAMYLMNAGGAAPAVDEPGAPTVATLTLVRGSISVDGEAALNPGDAVDSRWMRSDGGEAELMLTGGAVMSVTGPAEFRIDDGMNVTMRRGAARFDCPPQAVGFAVRAPGGVRIVDLGTRFGVNVDDDGSARLDVTQGRVRFEAGAQRVDVVAEQRLYWSVPTDAPAADDAAASDDASGVRDLRLVRREAWDAVVDLRGERSGGFMPRGRVNVVDPDRSVRYQNVPQPVRVVDTLIDTAGRPTGATLSVTTEGNVNVGAAGELLERPVDGFESAVSADAMFMKRAGEGDLRLTLEGLRPGAAYGLVFVGATDEGGWLTTTTRLRIGEREQTPDTAAIETDAEVAEPTGVMRFDNVRADERGVIEIRFDSTDEGMPAFLNAFRIEHEQEHVLPLGEAPAGSD